MNFCNSGQSSRSKDFGSESVFRKVQYQILKADCFGRETKNFGGTKINFLQNFFFSNRSSALGEDQHMAKQ